MKIVWNIVVWWQLEVQGYEVWAEFQWYRNDEAIIWETSDTYELVITDQWQEITCAVWIDWEITVLEWIFIDFYNLELKPIEKEYIVKLYDWNFNFVKVLPASLITNDISFSESIDAWQWEMTLNVNLPIDTDYFDNVRYCRVYVSDNRNIQDVLIYSGWLSKKSRIYSNNKENIQLTALSLYSLLNDVILRKNWAIDWSTDFSKTGDPANIIKFIVDYFVSIYPNTLNYTEDSIEEYGESITIKFESISCAKWLTNLVNWLDYYLFIWADWIVHFHNKPWNATHSLTYERDITALTIPESAEKVVNKVQVKYQIPSEVEWEQPTIAYTSIATDDISISLFGVKEEILSREDLETEASANLYRDKYIEQYKNLSKDITLTVNSLYPIELIHPWDTVKIMNLWLDIDNAQVNKITYKYEQIQIQLEYYQNIAQEIFNS